MMLGFDRLYKDNYFLFALIIFKDNCHENEFIHFILI